MYDGNYLAKHLRSSSLGREKETFATLPNGTVMTYGELFQGAERFAAALFLRGVQPGDRVAVQVEKSVEVLQLYVGTVLAGGIFLPLNTAYTPTEVRYFLSDASPTVFVCTSAALNLLTSVAKECEIASIETLDADGSGSLSKLASGQTDRFEAVERSKDDLAAILYTSGTTGRSKGAMLSHQNLWSNADTLKDYWHFTKEDVLIHALPIFHTHGLFVATNVTLAAGSSVLFMTGFNAPATLNAMNEATVLMGVPTFYVRLLLDENLTKDAVKNMRLFISGSAPLLAETHDSWRVKTGTAILERYGMTETNMNSSNPYDGDRRAGTVGYPLPGVDIRIVDPDSAEELTVGSIGSIEVKGPNVFQGYWKMPEKTKEELRENGYFITGDLGKIDEQGYLSIIGRSKDLIITGGFNVYPKELELIIDDIDGVFESAIIGLPHNDFGEAVTAVVVREDNATLAESDIATILATQVAKFKQPKRIIFADELPRNTMGKVQKNIMRDTYST